MIQVRKGPDNGVVLYFEEAESIMLIEMFCQVGLLIQDGKLPEEQKANFKENKDFYGALIAVVSAMMKNVYNNVEGSYEFNPLEPSELSNQLPIITEAFSS